MDVLKRLDAVVIDLADAGVRFYTYETTTGYFLEAAAKAGIDVVVLDRPNPIQGRLRKGGFRCWKIEFHELLFGTASPRMTLANLRKCLTPSGTSGRGSR